MYGRRYGNVSSARGLFILLWVGRARLGPSLVWDAGQRARWRNPNNLLLSANAARVQSLVEEWGGRRAKVIIQG